MKILKELIVIEKKSDVPVYLQIANAFIQNIRQGRFRKGLKLPGTRQCATLLGINRMTVVAAYQELIAQGWIETILRKGTFVKVHLPLLSPQKITDDLVVYTLPQKPGFSYDESKILPIHFSDFTPPGKLVFNDGFPDTRLTPTEELISSMRSVSRLPVNKKYLMYGGSQGTLMLRYNLASFLCDTRGLAITPENILITRGAQMGIYIASYVLLKPGVEVIVGAPGYPTATKVFQQLGAKINYAPVDDYGLDTDAVEKICKKKRVKMVYVIPHHHNPTTVTLIPERRMHLLELAAKYNFAIMEDDYDYDFHYASKPITPMASHDKNGNVIYVGTLAKTLAPAIRVGFIVAPEKFIKTTTFLRKIIDVQGDNLMENAIAGLFKDGTIARHIKKSVKLYKERRDHFCSLLLNQLASHVSFKIPDGGMSVWVKFLKNDLRVISGKALSKGLIISDGTDYDTEKVKYNAVRLGFASLNFKEQEKAFKILRELLNKEI
jgi:GntR family transcriptional regulator/MocR family aminotransferase